MKIAGIRFKENTKVYDFDSSGIDVNVGDRVIVESDRGQGFARVVRLTEGSEQEAAEEVLPEETGPQEENESAGPSPKGQQQKRELRKVIRKATEDDLRKEEKNREREYEAFTICQQMIEERELPMRLIRVEYTFDASRASFFFFSETRVDFRELVKELAYKLRTRIEMRQIGVRDVARLIGGFGPCGRELCCASFLRNFEPVSIRMAKKQEMVLNPAKISGVCGRLLCCLSYEYEFYDEIKKDAADLKDTTAREIKEKEEETRRMAAERDRREADERRRPEAKRRQDKKRTGREPRREKQKGSEPTREKKKDTRHEKPVQQEQPREGQKQRPVAQQPQKQQKDAASPEKKRKKRFWRKRRKKKK